MSETPDFPSGEFDVIYADPPWEYRDGTTDPSREIENHYSTMPLDDIKGIDVPAADDCVLYMWVTSPKVAEAVDVMRAWGFDYRTSAVWDKGSIGPGYWFRSQHEILYVGAKGSPPTPDVEARRSSVFNADRGEHSEKPEAVRTHIEQAHPEARKLEMFARDGKVGWDLWGDESPDSKQATLGNHD